MGSGTFAAYAIGTLSKVSSPAHEAAVTPRRTVVMNLLHITEVRANIATTVQAERPKPLHIATAKRSPDQSPRFFWGDLFFRHLLL